ncbi:MAG: hypothetical protein OXE83_02915 [Gammaproteobacteria bacterium]|nr:hypothetical protein [Gammaproteobacteria bacterium]
MTFDAFQPAVTPSQHVAITEAGDGFAAFQTALLAPVRDAPKAVALGLPP